MIPGSMHGFGDTVTLLKAFDVTQYVAVSDGRGKRTHWNSIRSYRLRALTQIPRTKLKVGGKAIILLSAKTENMAESVHCNRRYSAKVRRQNLRMSKQLKCI